MSRNPYLFILGCPRSGTTLLQRIVDAHPLIAVINETHWITRSFESRTGLTPEGLVTPKIIPELLEYDRFLELKINQEQLEGLIRSAEPVSYARFVTGIFDLYGEAQGKSLVGDKTPGYTRYIHTLHTLWPTTRIIHLIRDGRDVCLSVTNWSRASKLARRFATWSADPVSTAAMWWKWHVRLGREAGQSLGSDLYREIRYESLVAHPADECAALCAFLGVPNDDGMLRFHEGRTKANPKLSAKSAWLPITAGLRDWRRQMDAAEVERFEAAAGDLLDQLGYERGFPSVGAEAQKHASMIGDLFTRDARAQRRVLPRALGGV